MPPDHLPPLYVCLPGTGSRWFCGGLLAALRLLDVAREAGTGQLVTYTDRQADDPFLPDLLDGKPPGDAIFLITWGYHVPDLLQRLAGRRVAYYAHSTGYGFDVPSAVAILAGSRPALAYWGERAPRSPLYHLPPVLADEFDNRGVERDIDVLAFARKVSPYLRDELIPALASRCRVSVHDGYVEDVAGLFNRARVYLYDSQPYWREAGLSEGIGLQPLEALACGCRVFSSLNGGMAEYLDPAVNCGQIGVHSLEYDVARVLEAVRATVPGLPAPEILRTYRRPAVRQQLAVLLRDLHRFFDFHGV